MIPCPLGTPYGSGDVLMGVQQHFLPIKHVRTSAYVVTLQRSLACHQANIRFTITKELCCFLNSDKSLRHVRGERVNKRTMFD